MRINLIDCIPAGADGKRSLLPKQQQFFDAALDEAGPRYVLYAGGVGAAKTTIGAFTILTMAILFPGDYLVCRLFNPELRITSYKTFLDLCPKELIIEHRVADQIVKIRSANGGVSEVIFRGLEDPDKHRSLNLNAVWIDESSQVTEAAFTLLQSRLRGKHVRKILMTTNPAGMDWQWRLFVKQDKFDEVTKKDFLLIKAPSTENKHLPPGYVDAMLRTWSKERIERDIYASFESFSGQIYSEFNRDLHVIKPFKIPKEWTRTVGWDHGWRNPTGIVWVATDHDDNHYVYREYYEREKTIKEIANDFNTLSKGEKISAAYIDPSTKATRSQTGFSDYDSYIDYLRKDVPLIPGNNEVTAGIDLIKTLLKPDEKSKKPRLYIFETCTNLISEIVQYQWATQPLGAIGFKSEKEEPKKVDDHLADALRYCAASRILGPRAKKNKGDHWETPSNRIQAELEQLRNPKVKDAFGFGDL